MGIIILAVIKYIISFLCCMLFTYIISENKYTRLWWILISILIYSMSYITLNKYLPIEFLGDFLTLITISLMYKDTRSKKIKNFVSVYVTWQIIQTIVTIMDPLNTNNIYKNIIEQIIDLSIIFIIYLLKVLLKDKLYVAVNKMKLSEKNINIVNNIAYVLYIISITYMLLLIALSDYTHKYSIDERIKHVFGYFVIPSFISLCVIVILFAYVIVINKSQKIMIKNEEQFNQIQSMYYKTLMVKEQETKKFRHDIKNHLLYIYSTAKANNDYEIIKYIDSIEDEFAAKINIVRDVGNETFNILLNYYISMLKPDVKVTIEGTFKDDINISPLDINLIIGNVLKNSVEELNKSNDDNKISELHIIFQEGKRYVRITVINTILNEKSKWIKGDEEHGYGISIIQENVRKCNGQYEYKIEDDKYIVVITLRNEKNTI